MCQALLCLDLVPLLEDITMESAGKYHSLTERIKMIPGKANLHKIIENIDWEPNVVRNILFVSENNRYRAKQ